MRRGVDWKAVKRRLVADIFYGAAWLWSGTINMGALRPDTGAPMMYWLKALYAPVSGDRDGLERHCLVGSSPSARFLRPRTPLCLRNGRKWLIGGGSARILAAQAEAVAVACREISPVNGPSRAINSSGANAPAVREGRAETRGGASISVALFLPNSVARNAISDAPPWPAGCTTSPHPTLPHATMLLRVDLISGNGAGLGLPQARLLSPTDGPGNAVGRLMPVFTIDP
ncbi:unnamed protein product, partial [Iphiclides podalirius]